jgi:hypothetical protein
MNPSDLANQATRAAEHAMILAQQARDLAARGAPAVEGAAASAEPFLFLLTSGSQRPQNPTRPFRAPERRRSLDHARC